MPLNSLSRASSSYLRSAMHQPIQWHEWGEEAFAKARLENKPILLDIGAVWCHWCHVMDRESYDDPAVAEVVNQNYIAIKVDRDERPDIDSRYQIAVSAVSGQGGWPLTAFLTPDGKPFYGGTYFPPNDGYGRPSFRRVLLSIANAYREKNTDVLEQAKMLEHSIAHAESFAGRDGRVSRAVIDDVLKSALDMFDPRNGGFGHQPKFPHSSAVDLVIEQFARDGRADLRNLFETTLHRMADGGVYDQLAGGFHRYSVDERWIVPHFEKMCYDNSELLKNYVHAWQATGAARYAEVARDIIRWMDEWLSDRERGGFYASQDADYSMEDDGDYFTWTLDETVAVLDEDEAKVAALRYDINEVGEMHHNPAKNVLYRRASLDDIAARLKLTVEQVSQLLASASRKMYAARLQRPTPYVDKTMYVGWNALCVSAYLEAAKALHLPDARRFALHSLDRVLTEGWSASSGLCHVIAYSDPQAEVRNVPGVLDDYACTTVACLDAYEATADLAYFRAAQQIAAHMVDHFFDATSGGFCDTPLTNPHDAALGVLATPRKPFQDSPTPAGNPVAAIALLRLHAYTNHAAYRDKAEQTLQLLAGVAGKYGIFAATYGIAAVHLLEPHTQIVVIGEDELAGQMYEAAAARFAFNKAVIRLSPNQVVAENLPPALAQTIPLVPGATSGETIAIVCSGFACRPPLTSVEELRRVEEGDR
jgi:uncharacterized protein YyaL (SSP411 family)